ncbi:MAG TPA: hypothetical protein VFC68_02930 [Treponemataceae bacterium]|nr:hypothetical protein [Treponemataceae bacterium]
MNTIPLIFNERQFKRTVLGGSVRFENSTVPVTVLLLNRGGSHFRSQQLQTLVSDGFSRIICVESSADSYTLEDYSQNFPSVKFIIPLEKITPGEMINAGIAEADTEYVLVLWDDLKITEKMLSPTVYKKLTTTPRLCIAPYIQSNSRSYLPVRMVPSVDAFFLDISPEPVLSACTNTAYPFDSIGLYHREKFIQLGGFDYTITNSYWQILDFALRGWLWGEEIVISSFMKCMYQETIPLEDTTADYMQLRFYLKNTAPVFKIDHAYIPISRVFSYIKKSSTNLFTAISDFRDARKWVEKNKYRFKMDMPYLVENWECIKGFEK